MFNLIIFLLAVYGISNIISSEYLFSPLVDKFKKYDKVYYFLTCNKCLSVWVGFLISLLGFKIVHPLIDPFVAYTATCLLNRVLPD
jgi:hypothetical protein